VGRLAPVLCRAMDDVTEHLKSAAAGHGERIAYHAPVLRPMGALSEITRGGAISTTSDSGANLMMVGG
jgi:hypothetical protein